MVVVGEKCGRPLFLHVAACQMEAVLVEVKDLVRISFAAHTRRFTRQSLALWTLVLHESPVN